MHTVTRRTFAKSAVVASAGFALNGFSQTLPDQRRIGIAPIGLGSWAEVFMRSVGKSENAQLTGLVTGHPVEKGKKFAAMYGVADRSICTYETFDSIRNNHEIDAVYVALPNSMHCEYTIRAAEAGKHVFCEKPMATSSDECKRMIDACRLAGVKLMIGYRLHHEPVFLKLYEMVRSGAFGDILQFQAGFYGMKNKQEWRLNRALAGGGSMFDLGIYALNTVRWFTGEEPVDFRAVAATRDKTGKFTSVEETINCLLKFPSGIVAECGSSYGQNGTNFFQVNGTTGHVRVEPAFTYGDTILKYVGKSESGDFAGSGAVYDPDQVVTEITHFANCILRNTEPATPGEEGLKDLVSIENIYRAAGASTT